MPNHNLVLRGGGNYFHVGNSSSKFQGLDAYVALRMALLASDKHGFPGLSSATALIPGVVVHQSILKMKV